MEAASRPVRTNQHGLHPQLTRTVVRHAAARWRKPPQPADQAALDRLDAALDRHSGALILDSFCGTGMSTAILAGANPEALVVGIDKSEQRLGRGTEPPDNALLLRAHAEAVWRHLVHRQRRLAAHYLLYPNPWPKAAHLSRRVHGHPAFPLLLQLGGRLELRSNWQVYVEEFGVALHLLGRVARIAKTGSEEIPLTRFEVKYRDSGHDLWQLTAAL